MKTALSIKSMLLAATLSVVGTASALAETIIFLNAKPNIIGTSQFLGHEGEIILSGFSANIASANSTTPTSPGPPNQRAVCGRFTIIKQVDQTSPEFIQLALSGNQLTAATITIARTTADGLVTFATIKLQQVLVSSMTQNEPEPDASLFTETIALQSVGFTYSVDTTFFGINCAANKPI